MNLSQRLALYCEITRFDRPIGNLLLLWPTYWALWLANDGWPSIGLLIIFTLGVLLTRSAGCVINDFADRKIDGSVKRTANRPLATGRISSREALALFAGLMLLAFGLVLLTNTATIQLSFVALALASAYPFMKRFTQLPQVVLGAAFGMGIPMAFTASGSDVPPLAWVLYAANLCWTVAYDTMYAMVDRDDDLKIGVKSTAILFGRWDKLINGLLQLTTLALLIVVGSIAGLGTAYWLSLIGAAALFGYQQWLIRERQREPCFKAFLNNHYVGMTVFGGVFISLWGA